MRRPWANKTGLAKAAVILTTILCIATVSCGLNVALVLGSLSGTPRWVGNALFVIGWIELAAVIASMAGLLVVFIMWLTQITGNREKENHD